jgi:serine/threonine protein kinase
MKAVRERMKKTLSIKTSKVVAGPPGGRKVIRPVAEADFAKLYKLRREVMESTNAGMNVYFATRLADGENVVIKTRDKIKSFKSRAEEREWRCTTECQLNMPKVDTICQFLEVLETRDTYYVVMEKVDGKDLFEQMCADHIKQVDAREIVRQILDALNQMHKIGRIHKDLKLENVMVDMESPMKKEMIASVLEGTESPATVKLIDFDTAQAWEPSSPKAKDVLGTDGYIAPEAYAGEYSPASDIYCVGVIMYKMLTRRFPLRPDIFDDQPGENWVGSPAMKRIQDRLRTETIDFGRPPLDRLPEAADLCREMLRFDASLRPSAEEGLMHPWFQMPAEMLSPPASPQARRPSLGPQDQAVASGAAPVA